ncbi:hypothetical protein BH09BAC1_BH09BAC1_29790 [soil metagenome]
MKKGYALLLFTILTAGIMLAQVKTNNAPAPVKGPEITFEKLVVDYGTIPHMSDGVREFKFKNTGTEDLIISECGQSCGCTTPDCPKDIFAPGESGVVKVKYATDRVGAFMKTVSVNSNAVNSSVTLTIQGNVLPAEE